MIDPKDWPVLVTGAGGFVGGHVARRLAAHGHPVRGLTRRPPHTQPGDPEISWFQGDLREASVVRAAVKGMRAVVHAAGWVSLGADRTGEATSTNVDATRALFEAASSAGLERFVYTSTLHTLGKGTAEEPANEDMRWNLHTVDSAYSRTKRLAEELVQKGTDRLAGVVICPGMVLGPRDTKPTSTRLILLMATSRIVMVPKGGIPVVDSAVIAQAHQAALFLGEPGMRYAVVGPYLSYGEIAQLVMQVADRPRRVFILPDFSERLVVGVAHLLELVSGRRCSDVSPVAAAGGYLRLYVKGDRADQLFGLVHPDPIYSIHETLTDAQKSGRAPRLRVLRSPRLPER